MSCSLQYGRRALHVAAENGHTDVIDILVKHGADVDRKDDVRNIHVLVYFSLNFVFIILSSATILDDVHV